MALEEGGKVGWNWRGGGCEIRRQGAKEEGVEVQGGRSVQPPVPLCLFDKPLTVKSLPRCRRGRVWRDTEEEQVSWQRNRGEVEEDQKQEKEEKGDLVDVAARISGRSAEEINT